MNAWVAARQFARIVKWLLWAGFLGYSLYFVSDRAPHLNQFGNLSGRTELILFGLPILAVVAGLLELMFREKATPLADRLQQR